MKILALIFIVYVEGVAWECTEGTTFRCTNTQTHESVYCTTKGAEVTCL